MKEKRIKALREAVRNLETAKQKHDGYQQCYCVGRIDRMRQLLIAEHDMTSADVDEIVKSAK